MITISAFRWVPDFAQGQVRDLRARWALEEAGLPYKTRLLELGDQDKPEYRALQPFGQVPVLEENGLVLFESGAIVLHIGERSETLLPREAGTQRKSRAGEVSTIYAGWANSVQVPLVSEFFRKASSEIRKKCRQKRENGLRLILPIGRWFSLCEV